MSFAFRCFASNPHSFPCDLDWSVDPVVGVAISFAAAVSALGFFALILLLARPKQ